MAAAGYFSLVQGVAANHELGKIRGCSVSKGWTDCFIDIRRLCGSLHNSL